MSVEAGDKAPNFNLVKQDMSATSLSDYSGKVKILVAVPSLDTPVCAKEAKEFNTQVSGLNDAVAIVVSGDLPFAMKRYCAAEGVENVVTVAVVVRDDGVVAKREFALVADECAGLRNDCMISCCCPVVCIA